MRRYPQGVLDKFYRETTFHGGLTSMTSAEKAAIDALLEWQGRFWSNGPNDLAYPDNVRSTSRDLARAAVAVREERKPKLRYTVSPSGPISFALHDANYLMPAGYFSDKVIALQVAKLLNDVEGK